MMGDSGLEAVFLGSRSALLRFLRARGAVADAEDLLQELWIKIAQMPPTGPIADPLAYLYRAADNLLHDRRRSVRRREGREAAWGEAAQGIFPDALDVPSAEQVLVARDELGRVERAIAALGHRTAHIFRRYRLDGVGQKAIAAEHGVSLSAVEKHLQRAYRAIVLLQNESDDADLADRRRLDNQDHADARR